VTKGGEVVLSAELAAAAARSALGTICGIGPTDDATRLDHWVPHDELTLVSESTDPFGGRLDPEAKVDVMVQIAHDLLRYWGLARSDLANLGRALASCWRRLGVERGATVAIYDYATSPLTLYASTGHLPHLQAGAAELVGCATICNDGLPELAHRCVNILRYVKPQFLFVTVEAVDRLVAAIQDNPAQVSGCTIVVSSDEAVLTQERLDAFASATGLPTTQVLRVDGALFVAAPCPSTAGVFHPDPEHYVVEALVTNGSIGSPTASGRLAITNLSVLSSPIIRYFTQIPVSIDYGPCTCGSDDGRTVHLAVAGTRDQPPRRGSQDTK